MTSGSCLTSKLYDKIIKMPSKSHEPIPLNYKIRPAVLLSTGNLNVLRKLLQKTTVDYVKSQNY
jgi:hypothetical protein